MSFGFGFGFTKITAAIRAAFSPSSLFAANEPGVWYDPSDLSTLFQDAAGTTPVTAVEQPVGLMLDKSKGLVRGPELVANGDFSNGTTGWTAGSTYSASITASGGVLAVTTNSANGYGCVIQAVPLVAGKTYKITGTRRSASSGNPAIGLGVSSGAVFTILVAGSISTTTNEFAATFTYSGGSLILFNQTATNGAVSEFDNISVRELPGNHAYQTTATSRPVLSARYNVVQKSDQPADSYWIKVNLTVVENAVYETNVTGPHGIRILNPGLQAPAWTLTTLSAKVKANGRNYCLLYDNQGRYFDITPGTSGAVLGGNDANVPQASIEPLGDDWFLCRITYPGPATWHPQIFVSDTGARTSYAGDVTKGIYVTDIDLRPANQASLPYQRVNTATDYDTAGFPHYLRFDGVDDWMVTNTITPGIDKAQVFAGVRKLSDATTGAVLELSNTDSNNGMFWLFAPSDAGVANIGFQSRGSAPGSNAKATSLVAPTTRIVTGLGNISGDSTIIRIDGTQAASTALDQGTGNYGNYPLYIGRRGGTSFPFNGHLYNLIVRFGSNLPIATIENTEKYINSKTRAY